jgi:hypothetical protein
MTAKVTLGLRASGALLAWLCITAMLVTSLCLGIRSSTASGPSSRISVQQISSTRGAPAIPNRPCPHGGLSQSFGTCASAGAVGLDQSAIDRTGPVELESSRIAIAVDSVVALFLASRLERPPRF